MAVKTILLDMDSILAAIDKAWYGEARRRWAGEDICTEKVTAWNVDQFSIMGSAIFDIPKEPGFFRSLEPLPGAVDGTKRLVEAGHRVIILSAPIGKHSMQDKYEWVEEHLPFFSPKNIMFSHQKDIVHADVVFDDGPHNIHAFRLAQPDIRIATITYPYNMTALGDCDFVAGSYLQPQVAWHRFVKWVEMGAPSRTAIEMARQMAETWKPLIELE